MNYSLRAVLMAAVKSFTLSLAEGVSTLTLAGSLMPSGLALGLSTVLSVLGGNATRTGFIMESWSDTVLCVWVVAVTAVSSRMFTQSRYEVGMMLQQSAQTLFKIVPRELRQTRFCLAVSLGLW